VVDVAEFGSQLVVNQKCIFLAATHGEGEPTDNSKEFIKTLETKVANSERLPLFYSVFGLGNISYKYYNANAKNINNMLH
jgi:NADPH-ferrihemoprotein reductase